MTPKYWSIQEASRQLAVPPPVVRRWIHTGQLTAIRLGGSQGHRRILYDDIVRLANALGKPAPDPFQPVDPEATYPLEEAAAYLGVSPRFLWNQGLSLRQGGTVTGSDILGWETVLYGDQPMEEGEAPMMHHKMGRGPRHGNWGANALYDGPGFGPWGADWDEMRPHSILWLRSMKRHLEARKADIEDRLAWVEAQLAKAEAEPSEDR
jgi:excisionase family DNA binding protein